MSDGGAVHVARWRCPRLSSGGEGEEAHANCVRNSIQVLGNQESRPNACSKRIH